MLRECLFDEQLSTISILRRHFGNSTDWSSKWYPNEYRLAVLANGQKKTVFEENVLAEVCVNTGITTKVYSLS